MTKKILLIALCLSMIMTFPIYAQFSDVPVGSDYEEAINSLASMDVLSGYGNGSFGVNDSLTRAQFAKIVVKMTGNSDAALAKCTEVFTDVKSDFWAIGYINEAAELGMITGYPDGSFGPNENITFAQAITVVIRMLGYTADEVGTNWPADYINKAAELEITENLRFNNNGEITRGVAAYILNNALDADRGTNTNISVFKKFEDTVIYGINANNSTLKTDEVLTTEGTFKRGIADSDNNLGKKVTLRVNSDNEIDLIIPTEQAVKQYTVVNAYDDKIQTEESGFIDMEDTTVTFYKGTKTTYAAVRGKLTKGSKLHYYDNDYLYVDDTNTQDLSTAKQYTLINAYDDKIQTEEAGFIYMDGTTTVYYKGERTVYSAISAKLTKGSKLYFYDDDSVYIDENKLSDIYTTKQYTLLNAYIDKIQTEEAGFMDIEDNTIVYYNDEKTVYSAVYSKLTRGSEFYFYDDDSIYIEKNKLDGPYTVTSDYNQIYTWFNNVQDATLTIDGEAAKLNEIKKYDIVYYNPSMNSIYVYTDRVTGIYEKALPSKNALTGITVSGTSYNNIGITAKAKLDDTIGAFKINDRITLLFGNDGSVADVVNEDGTTLDDMGVVLSVSSALSNDENKKGVKEYYAEIALASGKTVNYKTDINYEDKDNIQYTGKFCYITMLKDGFVKLTRAEENTLEGSFDKSVPAYAGHDFMQNYSILECVYSEKYDEAIVKKINLSDIVLSSLAEQQVIHVEYANEMGDIAVLYVKDVANTGYIYGVLSKASSDENSTFSYELKSNSGTTNYSGSAGWTYTKGEAVMVMANGGTLKTIKKLSEIAVGTELDSYNNTKIMLDGKTYKRDTDITVVYKKTSSSEWNTTTLEELDKNVLSKAWNVSQITLYSDVAQNGKIRVVRVNLKG